MENITNGEQKFPLLFQGRVAPPAILFFGLFLKRRQGGKCKI
jgi:hypothetical protein